MTRSPRSDAGLARAGLVLGLASALLLGATTAALLSSGGSTNAAGVPGPAPLPTPAPTPAAVLALATGDVVPWDKPLTVTVADGTLESVAATAPDGMLLEGTLTPTSWVSTDTLLPGAAYALHVALLDTLGARSSYDHTVTASAASKVLKATVAPESGVYGIGQPVIVRFDRPVKSPEARRAVMARLQVSTTPAVPGAWRWYNSFEVHYRGQTYWKPGTAISTVANLDGLRVPGTSVWGGKRAVRSSFTIGDALIGVVDVTAHTLTVSRNGKVVRVIKVSTGRKEYPTKGGVHIVLKREKVHLFNSATVGIPTASPDGYYEKMPWSVRISNGGAFVHTNAATIRYQGVVNVSHGCVNASPTDAKWFYENTRLGDVVDVVHSAVGPNRFDAGMADWNYSWAAWQQGNVGG